METIEVTIKPEHFRDAPTGYHGNYSCPLWQALNEKFPNSEVYVGAKHVTMDGEQYGIPSDEWGFWGRSRLMSASRINDLSKAAKESLEGIPTISLTLTKITENV